MSYKQKYNLNYRIDEYNKILINYPNKIPIICETRENDLHINKIDKIKFLVEKDLTIGQFMCAIRKNLKVPHERAIYLLINNNIIPPTGDIIGKIYNLYKDPEDSMLYILIGSENFFGY